MFREAAVLGVLVALLVPCGGAADHLTPEDRAERLGKAEELEREAFTLELSLTPGGFIDGYAQWGSEWAFNHFEDEIDELPESLRELLRSNFDPEAVRKATEEEIATLREEAQRLRTSTFHKPKPPCVPLDAARQLEYHDGLWCRTNERRSRTCIL